MERVAEMCFLNLAIQVTTVFFKQVNLDQLSINMHSMNTLYPMTHNSAMTDAYSAISKAEIA